MRYTLESLDSESHSEVRQHIPLSSVLPLPLAQRHLEPRPDLLVRQPPCPASPTSLRRASLMVMALPVSLVELVQGSREDELIGVQRERLVLVRSRSRREIVA